MNKKDFNCDVFYCVLVSACRFTVFFFWRYCLTTVTPFIRRCRVTKGVTVVVQQSQKNSKTTSRHRNTVEYIAGKSFLFISLKEKLDLTLFSSRRSQYFISYTKSLIFNGRL